MSWDKLAAKLRKYVITLLIVGIAVVAHLAMGHFFGVAAPFVTLYPAIILVVLIGGLSQALLAILLGAVSAALFFLNLSNPGLLLTLFIYCFSGLLLTVIAYRLEKIRTERARQESEEHFRNLYEKRTKQLEEQALLSERERDRLLTLVNSMNDGVWFTDTEGHILLTNSVAQSQAREVGLDPSELSKSLPATLLSQVEMFAPNGKPLNTAPLMRVYEGESFREIETVVRNKKTGEAFYRRISGNPIMSRRENKVEAAIIVVRDITAEKRAEEQNARLEEQLQQSQKLEAIGTLAGGIAHDFNNMLAVIIGNAELALDDLESNNGAARNIDRIIEASKRARDLVKQILAFSRKTSQARNSLHLTPLIKETYKLLRGTLPSTIRIDVNIQTESDTVLANPSQMQQVLMNLVTNAAYAMRGKGGLLTIGLSVITVAESGPKPDPEMSPGTYVKLSVSDTGIGVTQQVRQRIFEPFFTTKPPGEGTGMGLAVIYGIARTHEGAITVESEPGRGSTFTFFLPQVSVERAEKQEDENDTPPGTERILLVDDEPSVVEAASQTLRRLGYSVTTAQNGPQALKLFLDEPRRFDLIITDQTMPDLTGIDMARSMLEVRKDLPIILFTGYSETVSPEAAKAAGIREFVLKPVDKREVAKTVRRVLDNTGRSN